VPDREQRVSSFFIAVNVEPALQVYYFKPVKTYAFKYVNLFFENRKKKRKL